MYLLTKHSSVLAANPGEAPALPAHRGDHPLRWTSIIAGLFNSTPGINAVTAPLPGGSMSILPFSTGSAAVHNNTSFSSTSTSTLEKPFPVPIVTVTERTTVTETSCSDSPTSISSLKSVSISPSSLIEDDGLRSMVPTSSGVPKPTLIPAINTPGTAALSSSQQTTTSTVFMITQTAWTTTWTSVTAPPVAPISTPAKASHSSGGEGSIDGKPQQPIDQAYAKPFPLPTTTLMVAHSPVLTNSTTSCTSNGTTSLAVSISRPTVHTGLPVFGTAGTRIPKVTQSLHPVPKIPIIPNLPFGHPPSFSNHTVVRNHTTVSFYHENPTVHPGTASITKHHGATLKASSTIHPAAKCTTTFSHSPTQPCTSTSYAHTKTIAVDCYGCVGEQAQIIRKAGHEGKVRISFTTERYVHNITNQFQQICNNSTIAIITLPISKKSVCAVPMVATGGSVHSKGQTSSTHVGSSGFVTSTSAGVRGSGYGHGNWTGIA